MALCTRHVKKFGIFTKISIITDIINPMHLENGTHVYKTKKTHCRKMGGKLKRYLIAEKNNGKTMPIKSDIIVESSLLRAEIPLGCWY
jgi:hypothetical protein